MLKVPVQVLFLVEALAAEAARPLAGPVLRFGRLLRPEDVARRMERTVDGDFHLVLFENWKPFGLDDLAHDARAFSRT